MTDELQVLLKSYGKLFRDLRAKKKLKQDEMAALLGINYRYYQDLEGGKRNFKVETLIKILSHHQVPVGHVISHTGHNEFLNSILGPVKEIAHGLDDLRDGSFESLEYLNKTHLGIQFISTEGLIVYCNDTNQFFNGYTPSEVMGKMYCWDFSATEKEVSYLKEYYMPFLKEKEPPAREYFTVNKKKDGKLLKMVIHWDYIRNHENKSLGYVALLDVAP